MNQYRINSLDFLMSKGCFYKIFLEQKLHKHKKVKERVKNAT